MEVKNAKFAITTKSGRSVVKEFDNYEQAQKYAAQHFGKGCVVTLVGNAVRSTNSVVANALAANAATNDAKVAGNGDVLVEFKTPDKDGMKQVSVRMSPSKIEEWLTKTGNKDYTQPLWESLMKGKDFSFLHYSPIKVTVKAL